MKKLLILFVIMLSFASTQSAVAAVRVGLSIPVSFSVDKTLKKDGFPRGASFQVQVPFTMFGLGFDFFVPKVSSKGVEAAQDVATAKGNSTDGIVANGTMGIKSLDAFFIPPIPYVDVLVGGGVSFVSLSKVGIDLEGFKSMGAIPAGTPTIAGSTPAFPGVTDINYKSAVGWNVGVNVGIPIVSLVNFVVGYRYVSAKLKPSHNYEYLPEINVGSSIITTGLSIGF